MNPRIYHAYSNRADGSWCGVSANDGIAFAWRPKYVTCIRCRVKIGLEPDPRWKDVRASILPYERSKADVQHGLRENVLVLYIEVHYKEVYTSRILFEKTIFGSQVDVALKQTLDDMVEGLDALMDERENNDDRICGDRIGILND